VAQGPYFKAETFRFLEELAENNRRDWFTANRGRYEEHVREPALRFIQDFSGHLAALSPHFHAGPRSLLRVHRDIRFSRDKSPYKPNTGIQFRHDAGGDIHAPGYYFHIEPGMVFAGLGLWHPHGTTLRKIRERIAEKPAAWRKASRDPAFTATFTLSGQRLSRPPRGFDPGHPLVEDLKWKDFIGSRDLDEAFACGPHLPEELARVYAAGTDFMAFLCKAVDVPY
jgi:uncharacterized protein (TIGR02453 family)